MLLSNARLVRVFHCCMANPKMNYVSAEGLEKLRAELVHLKKVSRRELADRIEAAKALGDLSENAEYHEAKDELSMIESRIVQIQDILNNFTIIEEGVHDAIIRIGSTLEVESNGKKRTYTIVGANEADPINGKISNESPIGSAFLGHAKGETLLIETPIGPTEYTIVNVM